jgi:hypothetical protein
VRDGNCLEWGLSGKGRGYYLNDQRIEFTGVEALPLRRSIPASSALLIQVIGQTQIFLNQPYDPNV